MFQIKKKEKPKKKHQNPTKTRDNYQIKIKALVIRILTQVEKIISTMRILTRKQKIYLKKNQSLEM